MNDRPSTNDATQPQQDAEEQTVRLLRLAGPRPPAPTERAARVHQAVHLRWQMRSRQRVMRRRAGTGTALLAAAAALMLVAGRVILVNRSGVPSDPGSVVGTVERMDGSPRGGTAPLALHAPVRTGMWIETDATARVGIRLHDGASVRLDAASRARALSPTIVELSAGAVYVDTGRTTGGFEVRTPLATAHDIGTQFEVRLIDAALRLRVRTGTVELKAGARSVSGRAGTEVTFSRVDAITSPVPAYGPEWDWTASLASPVDMEGSTLATFVERMAAEHGWTVRYVDTALAGEASRIVLHGSVQGLAARAALEVAITTSGLEHRLENGELTVFRGPGATKSR